MGQRAYRGKYTDSLVRDYVNNKGNSLEDQYFFSGKPKDLKFTYDLDDPLKDIDVNTINLNRGLLNCIIPKNSKINNLNLTIKSKILGTKISYLYSNLYCLFGTHFIKDISFINISLYNPDTGKYVNERRLIKNILDFMCFKSIKLVNINKNLMYYVIPENSEFAIVLAYKEINYSEKHANFLLNLEDLIFHPYSKFFNTSENFKQCLGAIDKTIPKDVTNLVLPTIIMDFPSIEEIEKSLKDKSIKNEDESMENFKDETFKTQKTEIITFSCLNTEDKINLDINLDLNKEIKDFKIFQNLNDFLKEIQKRNFRVISFELKIKLDKLDEYNTKNDNIKFNHDKKKNVFIDLMKENSNKNDFEDKLDYNDNDINKTIKNKDQSFINLPLDLSQEDNNIKQNSEFQYSNQTSKIIKKICCCNKKPRKNGINEEEKIKSYSEQYIKLVRIFLKENLDILKSFQQVFITFDFNFNNYLNIENTCSHRNEYIAYHFKKLLIKFDLENVSLIHHINFSLRNEQTSLEDQYDFLDYIFFNRDIADDLYKKLYLFKHSRQLMKISRKKSIMYKILSEFLFDFSHSLFKEGRFDYSFQILKNMKIVPMQINTNSTMIFMNN